MNLKAIITIIRLLLKDRKKLWVFLGPIVLDFAKEVSDEVLVAAAQVTEELLSSDGLTALEARQIAATRLKALIGEEIGNPMTDEAFDFVLTLILKRVQPKIVGVPAS